MENRILERIQQDVRELSRKIDAIHEKIVVTKTNSNWLKFSITIIVGWLLFISKVLFNIKF